MAGGKETGIDLSRKFVSEAELDEKRKKRQEEWEKVRKPDDPENAPEEVYDPRSLFERLQEQKDKKQEEFEEQFKFRNMVRGLDEDETSFLDEVSRQQCLVEKQRRDEENQQLLEYRSALVKQASSEIRKEPEKKVAPKNSGVEQRTCHLSQANLLAGAVKRRRTKNVELEGADTFCEAEGKRQSLERRTRPTPSISSQLSDGSKKQKVEISTAATTTGSPERRTEQEDGSGGGGARGDEDQQTVRGPTAKQPSAPPGVFHLPSAAVCVGVLPGLSAYSGSSDSDSSSDSEGSVDAIMLAYPRHSRAYR